MAYYVPLGPRGGFLRLGTLMIDIVGGWTYRRASRRRAATFANPTIPAVLLETLLVE